MASTSYISTHTSWPEQSADVAFFGVEQKLQDLQLDFYTGTQLCFDPFLLDSPKKDALSLVKRMWHQLMHKAEARIAARAQVEAGSIIALMEQFLAAMKQTYQKVQFFSMGTDHSPRAIIDKGLSINEQQDIILAVLAPLATIINAHLKHNLAPVLVIDNALISNLVTDAHAQHFSQWQLWRHRQEQKMIRTFISVDLWVLHHCAAQGYYACLYEYYNLFASAESAQKQPTTQNQLAQLTQKIKDTIEHIAITIDSVEDATTKDVLEYITSHLEKIEQELEMLTICSSFTESMLAELFALHQAILNSPGFCIIKEKTPTLAENYARLSDTFFRHQPNNPLFLHQLHKTMQIARFQANFKKPHEPVGAKDYVAKFLLVIYAIFLGTSREPMLETLDQMLIVLHAATEWHSNDRKQASSLLEWLLPKGLRDNPTLQHFMQNNNILGHIAALGIVPAGYKIAHMAKKFLGADTPQEAPNTIKDLLQLAKDNPAVFEALTQQDPKILERLAAHFAPRLAA